MVLLKFLGLLVELKGGKQSKLLPLDPLGELKSSEHLAFIDLLLH